LGLEGYHLDIFFFINFFFNNYFKQSQ
jgi:hypothetical protein